MVLLKNVKKCTEVISLWYNSCVMFLVLCFCLTPKAKRQKKQSGDDDVGPMRRNPSRSARFQPTRFDLPRTRSRSGSISSVSSSSSSTPLSTPEVTVAYFFMILILSRLQNCPRIRGFPWFPCAFPRKKKSLPRIKNSEKFFFFFF
jgi:hypothetical protein